MATSAGTPHPLFPFVPPCLRAFVPLFLMELTMPQHEDIPAIVDDYLHGLLTQDEAQRVERNVHTDPALHLRAMG